MTDVPTERSSSVRAHGHTHKHTFAHPHPARLLLFEHGAKSHLPHLASSPNLLLLVPLYSGVLH